MRLPQLFRMVARDVRKHGLRAIPGSLWINAGYLCDLAREQRQS